jgi:hypothetical protein
MTIGQNPFNPSPTLPTLAAIQRRRRELLAYHAARQAAQATNPGLTLDESLSGEESYLEEQSSLIHDEQHEEQQEGLHDPYPGDDPQPSLALPPQPSAPLSPALTDPALHGLAGLVVRSLAPHTEADPAAVLLQFLAAFGNLVGPAPHCRVGPTRHGLNLFVVLVGESSKARKGTSWRQISSLFAEVDPGWAAHRVTIGRPTVKSILHAQRDQQPVADRRLFMLSEEFASVIHLLGRETGQLSPLLRCAWDGGDLSAHDVHHPLQATAPHLSIVGHITQSDLAHHLSRTESHNGFANRCLWTSVRRGKSLPEGGSLPPEPHATVVRELRRTLDWVQGENDLLFARTPAARDLWNNRYDALSQGREDAFGAATSRAEAQVPRLSAIYAALDRSPVVDACHLHAALAVWDYCRASARLLFDTAPIDPTARRISQALDVAPQGLSRVQIRALFNRHVSKDRIDLALEQLMTLGLIHRETAAGRGRSATLWTKLEATKPVDTDPYGA